VKLNSGNVFNGSVNDVVYMGKNKDSIDIYLIEITDKFGKIVAFNSNDILIIKEEER